MAKNEFEEFLEDEITKKFMVGMIFIKDFYQSMKILKKIVEDYDIDEDISFVRLSVILWFEISSLAARLILDKKEYNEYISVIESVKSNLGDELNYDMHKNLLNAFEKDIFEGGENDGD